MKKSVYYLVWVNDPQWWGQIIKGERGYGYDTEITFLEEVTIDCAIGRFLLDLMERDTHFIRTKDFGNLSPRKDYGCSISEKEYNRIKKQIELYPFVEQFGELSGMNISMSVKR